MRLVGVTLGHQHPRVLGRSGLEGLRLGLGGEALEQVLQLTSAVERLEVADRERRAALRRPAPGPEGHDSVAGERVTQMLGGAKHGTPERVVAEHRAVDQMLGHHRRLVVGAGDLLNDDPALSLELLGIDARPRDEVGEQVGGLQQPLGAGRDVKRDEVVAGVGVEHRADRLGGLVDVPVVRVFLAAFEHQML